MSRIKIKLARSEGGFSLQPVHPGRTLTSELSVRGLTAHALARKLRVPANRISEIVAKKRGISSDTALRLGRYFATGAAFWARLQTNYDLARTFPVAAQHSL